MLAKTQHHLDHQALFSQSQVTDGRRAPFPSTLLKTEVKLPQPSSWLLNSPIPQRLNEDPSNRIKPQSDRPLETSRM